MIRARTTTNGHRSVSQYRHGALLAVFLLCFLILSACGRAEPTPTPTTLVAPTSTPKTDMGALEEEPTPTATARPIPTLTPTSAATASDKEPTLPQVSFEGKTIAFVVGFAPGGGYDTFSRIASQVLPEYLPGNPKFVIQNIPGAGGQRGLQ